MFTEHRIRDTSLGGYARLRVEAMDRANEDCRITVQRHEREGPDHVSLDIGYEDLPALIAILQATLKVVAPELAPKLASG